MMVPIRRYYHVTGIRENTRTSVLNFVFKRPQQKKEKK